MDEIDMELTVTSSDLVRHFGVWQERAVQAPVYIIHRSRPRLVLVSIELMQALCARADAPSPVDGEHLSAIIEAYRDAVLILNGEGLITHFNQAARTRFRSLRQRMKVASFGGASFLAKAASRVSESGTSEEIQVRLPDRPRREYIAQLDSIPGGVVIVLRDATTTEQLHESEATVLALTDAFEANGTTATFRLDLRGALIEPRQSFATMLDAVHEQLQGARLVTLVAVAERPKVAAMIEGVLASGIAAGEQVNVLIGGREAKPARLSLSSVNAAGRITELRGCLSLL